MSVQSEKGAILPLLVVGLLILGIVVGTGLVKVPQIFKPKAYDSSTLSSNGLNINVLQLVKDGRQFEQQATGNRSQVLVGDLIYFKGWEEPGTGMYNNQARMLSVQIDEAGRLKDPIVQRSLPKQQYLTTLTAYNRYIYSIGGFYGSRGNSNFTTDGRKVYKAEVLTDGSLSEWQEVTTLPTSMHYQAAFPYKERIYILGGVLVEEPSEKHISDRVYSIDINKDGSLGSSWTEVGKLPSPSANLSNVVFDNGYFYLASQVRNDKPVNIYSFQITSDGKVNNWQTLVSPEYIGQPSIHILDGQLIVYENETFNHAQLTSDGKVGTWTKSFFEDTGLYRTVFSGNYGYSFTSASPSDTSKTYPRSVRFSFGQNSSPNPSPTVIPSADPNGRPTTGSVKLDVIRPETRPGEGSVIGGIIVEGSGFGPSAGNIYVSAGGSSTGGSTEFLVKDIKSWTDTKILFEATAVGNWLRMSAPSTSRFINASDLLNHQYLRVCRITPTYGCSDYKTISY